MSPPHARRAVALESTLLAHGVPHHESLPLARRLESIAREEGAHPATVAVLDGRPVAGLSEPELERLLAQAASPAGLPKLNTSNLGLAIHRRLSGATTVSTTMEIAAAAGIRLFATGGLGGVHRGYGTRLDVSSDLLALARFPVAVVCSGVKSILDVVSTREALETLGVPVVGFRCDRFPAFYLRASDAAVDARFDDESELAEFLSAELARTSRGIVVANPVPEPDAIDPAELAAWLDQAATTAAGRDATPAALAALHAVSGGRTLRSNLALAEANTRLAARLAARLDGGTGER